MENPFLLSRSVAFLIDRAFDAFWRTCDRRQASLLWKWNAQWMGGSRFGRDLDPYHPLRRNESGGHEFLNVPASLEGVIRKEGPASRYVADQLPQAAMLDEMLGACPGFPGEVRLRYCPLDEPEDKIETPWRETHVDTDYAVQFKLDGLKAGISYGVELEARPIGGQSHTSAFKGAFKTAHALEYGGPLRFCVTTCHDFLRRDDGLEGHLIYQPMQLMHPDFVVHAGDIEYYDKPKPWAWTVKLMRFK